MAQITEARSVLVKSLIDTFTQANDVLGNSNLQLILQAIKVLETALNTDHGVEVNKAIMTIVNLSAVDIIPDDNEDLKRWLNKFSCVYDHSSLAFAFGVDSDSLTRSLKACKKEFKQIVKTWIFETVIPQLDELIKHSESENEIEIVNTIKSAVYAVSSKLFSLNKDQPTINLYLALQYSVLAILLPYKSSSPQIVEKILQVINTTPFLHSEIAERELAILEAIQELSDLEGFEELYCQRTKM